MISNTIVIFFMGILSYFLLNIFISVCSIKSEITKMNIRLDHIEKHFGISSFDEEKLYEEINNLLCMNKRVKSIKYYKDITGLGLKESKEYIELVEKNMYEKALK